ncbi:uncharacterized protein JCM6883_004705 [Sporobolomyces salmoneus]|uniref:uncharacterized protein n=1 Tax=Sporobolomyces salmoneus TaxID=183962 RepID=UPI003181D674
MPSSPPSSQHRVHHALVAAGEGSLSIPPESFEAEAFLVTPYTPPAVLSLYKTPLRSDVDSYRPVPLSIADQRLSYPFSRVEHLPPPPPAEDLEIRPERELEWSKIENLSGVAEVGQGVSVESELGAQKNSRGFPERAEGPMGGSERERAGASRGLLLPLEQTTTSDSRDVALRGALASGSVPERSYSGVPTTTKKAPPPLPAPPRPPPPPQQPTASSASTAVPRKTTASTSGTRKSRRQGETEKEKVVDDRWRKFTLSHPFQIVRGGLQPRFPVQSCKMLDSLSVEEQRTILGRILKLNEERDNNFNHVLPPSNTDDLDDLLLLAPMLPLSALESVRTDSPTPIRPITGTTLNRALAEGSVDHVEWYCYEIAAYSSSLEVANKFGRYLSSPEVEALAIEASANKIFPTFVKSLGDYVKGGGWPDGIARLFNYIGWSQGWKWTYEGAEPRYPRPFEHFVTDKKNHLSLHQFLLRLIRTFIDTTGSIIDVTFTFLGTANSLPAEVEISTQHLMQAEALLSVARDSSVLRGGANVVSCGNVVVTTLMTDVLASLPSDGLVSEIAALSEIPSSLRLTISRRISSDITLGAARRQLELAKLEEEAKPRSTKVKTSPTSFHGRHFASNLSTSPRLRLNLVVVQDKIKRRAPRLVPRPAPAFQELTSAVQQQLQPFRNESFFPSLATIAKNSRSLTATASIGAILTRSTIRGGVDVHIQTKTEETGAVYTRLILCVGDESVVGVLTATGIANGTALLRWDDEEENLVVSRNNRVLYMTAQDGPKSVQVPWVWDAETVKRRVKIRKGVKKEDQEEEKNKLDRLMRALLVIG